LPKGVLESTISKFWSLAWFEFPEGYMDPGNWATDIAGGSSELICSVLVSLMSNPDLCLQSLSARLGIVTQRIWQASRRNISQIH
jgi:manganese transport protein